MRVVYIVQHEEKQIAQDTGRRRFLLCTAVYDDLRRATREFHRVGMQADCKRAKMIEGVVNEGGE